MDYDNLIDFYLSKPYWIVDILPKQVPANGKGQYFKVEQYFLKSPLVARKFAHLLLKLNCYEDLAVCCDGNWTVNPVPDDLAQWVCDGHSLQVLMLTAKAMIVVTGDDHYLTLYNPEQETLHLITTLASSEGLFVWQPDSTAL